VKSSISSAAFKSSLMATKSCALVISASRIALVIMNPF
jgi:hypothetical protein